MTPLGGEAARTLMVFSHPNHELAVYGLLQRLRPNVLYLTDGGSAERVSDSRTGLAAIGLLGQARFLGYTEASFYGALLDRDVAFCREVVHQIAAEIDRLSPEQVLCDGVEFYNPVHDLTLPFVVEALRGRPHVRLFEIPLIHQRPGPSESYRIQRLPPSRTKGQIVLRLSAEELDAKLRARDRIYRQLRLQLGDLLDVSAAEAAVESARAFTGPLPTPSADRILRYERRGALLKERGEVREIITYAGHFLPLTAALGS